MLDKFLWLLCAIAALPILLYAFNVIGPSTAADAVSRLY